VRTNGEGSHVEGLVEAAIGTVEAAQRAVRVLPPEERFEIALDTLADALDPARVGGPDNAPDVRAAAVMVMDARHELKTAQHVQGALRRGDGSIPHEDEDLTGCQFCGAAQGEGHAIGCTAPA